MVSHGQNKKSPQDVQVTMSGLSKETFETICADRHLNIDVGVYSEHHEAITFFGLPSNVEKAITVGLAYGATVKNNSQEYTKILITGVSKQILDGICSEVGAELLYIDHQLATIVGSIISIARVSDLATMQGGRIVLRVQPPTMPDALDEDQKSNGSDGVSPNSTAVMEYECSVRDHIKILIEQVMSFGGNPEAEIELIDKLFWLQQELLTLSKNDTALDFEAQNSLKLIIKGLVDRAPWLQKQIGEFLRHPIISVTVGGAIQRFLLS